MVYIEFMSDKDGVFSPRPFKTLGSLVLALQAFNEKNFHRGANVRLPMDFSTDGIYSIKVVGNKCYIEDQFT